MESPSPDPLIKESDTNTITSSCSSPIISPISDKLFWSNLRNRIDTLLENQKDQSLNYGEGRNRTKRLKEDSLLLLRGFDSVASSLSQLSNNLDNALQGAKDLARPPTLSDVLHSSLEHVKRTQNSTNDDDEDEDDQNLESNKRGLKRKLDPVEVSDENQKEFGKLNRAKNIAVSMAKKAGFLAREVKSMKSDLCFMQERCSILEEENRRLRDGFVKGIPPEEDDLVRLQLEALLAEKSRLANDNANLTRENQCLRQLVEYHQLTSRHEEDEVVEEDYEDVIRGVCLDFSSPPPRMPENPAGDGISKIPQPLGDL